MLRVDYNLESANMARNKDSNLVSLDSKQGVCLMDGLMDGLGCYNVTNSSHLSPMDNLTGGPVRDKRQAGVGVCP